MNDTKRYLVNRSALKNCIMSCAGFEFQVFDISFVRVVVERKETNLSVNDDVPVELSLDRHVFGASAVVQLIGNDFIRFSFSKLVPSAQARLRAFLSPRKVGESLTQDWTSQTQRHFHGLNDSELWVSHNGEMLFSFLDQSRTECQFIIHIAEGSGLRAGRLPRKDYMALGDIGNDLPLTTNQLDRDTYQKLGECRDIITNFRPVTQAEYGLKQRLLKAISDHLYSTSHKVDWTPSRASSRTTSAGAELAP